MIRLNFIFYIFLFCTFAQPIVSIAHAIGDQRNSRERVLRLEGLTVLNKSIVLTSDTRVVASKSNPAIVRTNGNFPAFIVRTRNVVFDGIKFEGLKFAEIESDMDRFEILNSSFIDLTKSDRAMVVSKSSTFRKINFLKISGSAFEHVTPVFLQRIDVREASVSNSSFKNVIRYGVRIKNDSHQGEGKAMDRFFFTDNTVDGLSAGIGKAGVARMIMLTAGEKVVITGNKIKDIQGVQAGGNLLYWSGQASLDFSDNYVENISGNTFAIQDKGVSGNNPRVISNNTFVQSKNSSIRALIHIYQSSNYTIKNNEFVNLNTLAIYIGNTYPASAKRYSRHIVVSDNVFKNVNTPQVISILQMAEGVRVERNIIDGMKNSSGISANGESSPRLLSLYASDENSLIKDVVVDGNVIRGVSEDFSLLWVNKVRRTKNETILDITLRENLMNSGQSLAKLRNNQIGRIVISRNKTPSNIQRTIGIKQQFIDAE